MKNKLSDLQNHLFEMMERLMEYDEEESGEEIVYACPKCGTLKIKSDKEAS